jgi:hypothetical protein
MLHLTELAALLAVRSGAVCPNTGSDNPGLFPGACQAAGIADGVSPGGLARFLPALFVISQLFRAGE